MWDNWRGGEERREGRWGDRETETLYGHHTLITAHLKSMCMSLKDVRVKKWLEINRIMVWPRVGGQVSRNR